MRLLKKILKILAWVAGSLIILLILLAIIIQIPFVQNSIIQKLTAFVSNKTHTKVEIKRTGITFPKSIFISGLYLEDLSKDTLLYAGTIKVNIDMMELIKGKINLSSVFLDDLTANVLRKDADSLYNFNFLIKAFTDSSRKTPADTGKKNAEFNIDKVDLKNIRILVDDKYGGLHSNLILEELHLKMQKLNLINAKYDVDNLEINGLNGMVAINKKSTDNENQKKSLLPWLTADNIEINKSNIDFNDITSSSKLNAVINKFSLKKTEVNLNAKEISCEKIFLEKNLVSLNLSDSLKADSVLTDNTSKSNWKITVKNIDLKNNKIAYHIINKPTNYGSFNPNHLDYSDMSLNAENIFYSSSGSGARITHLSFTDANGFKLNNLSVNFRMNEHSIKAENLKIKTPGSDINSSISIAYSSISHIKDSLQNLIINTNLAIGISTTDILFFLPGLRTKPFFGRENRKIAFSGKISGPFNNLKGKDISVTTGDKTDLKTSFVISGLPDINKANFDFPDLKLSTGKKDLTHILGPGLVPEKISIPDVISINARFKGKIKSFHSIIGIGTNYGNLSANISLDRNEDFTGKLWIEKFNVGSLLLNHDLFGPVSLTAEISGRGLDKKSINADIKLESSSLYLNKYVYTNLKVDGTVSAQEFEGKIALNDSNLAFNLNGLANITPGKEHYKFNLNLEGADLKKINLSKDDLRISAKTDLDLKGKDFNSISGRVGINDIILVKHDEKYRLDSLVYVSINENRNSELALNSAIVGIKFKGTIAPGNIIPEIKKQINYFFPISDEKSEPKENTVAQHFSFEIQMHNHPILSEIFLPGLTEFEPDTIAGSFDGDKNELKIKAGIKKLSYSGSEVMNLKFVINSDKQKFNYSLSTDQIITSGLFFNNLSISGNLEDQKASFNISSTTDDGTHKLLIKSIIRKEPELYRIEFNPTEFYLGGLQWKLPGDNYISFNKSGILFHNFLLENESSLLSVNSLGNKFNGDIKISVKNFNITSLSKIVEKDTALVEGSLNADVTLKRTNNSYGLISNVDLAGLKMRNVALGDLKLKGENLTGDKFSINASLKGNENDLKINGYFIPADSINGINMQILIDNLSVKTLEALSMNQISESGGGIQGEFQVSGNTKQPDISGSLILKEVYFRPAVLNNKLYFKNEKILLSPSVITFSDFTIIDEENHRAQIDGSINMRHFSDWNFGLEVSSDNFMIFNTTDKDNKQYYGKMIVDSKVFIKGTKELPVVNAKIKLDEGSNFTFAVPEKKISVDKGENVILFMDSLKLNPILTRNGDNEKQKSEIKGFDISANIEVDEKASLRLLIDPATNDSLVVKGDAALSFNLDPSGKISLTGTYNLSEGSYIASLQSFIRKKFDIEPGSTITWNGDLLDADADITAVYTIRTSAIDLVANQISGLSDAEKNAYNERLTFLVYLKLKGPLLKPDISFEIQLPQEDKGALGGSVNAKLTRLNEDPSSLNKQVFALLVLGRFVQENPLESESSGGGAASLARNSVSSFLTAQLNQLGNKVLPGVELNFNVQSYDDYTSGQAEGRTQVEVGLKKQLLNDKLTVQVGGTVDVEGEKARQNNVSEITGDISLEYKITDDGRYRLKGFRHNQYEGALEGQLVETGAGIVYTRDFDRWKDFFSRPEKKEKKKNVVEENK